MYKSFFLPVTLLLLFATSCKKEVETSELGSNQKIAFNLPDGFELEQLYNPSLHDQGSWVAMAQGPKNKIFACLFIH